MGDFGDEIREKVNDLGMASPLAVIGTGLDKIGQAAKGYLMGIPNAVKAAVAPVVPVTPKPPLGDIELPKEPKLMMGSDKRVVAENIRTLINGGMPEEQAIITAMRHARGATP